MPRNASDRRPPSWLAAFAIVLSVAAGARAQQPSYESLVDEGLQEYARGNWAEAYTLLQQADQLQPNARTQRGLGMVAFEMRRYPLAMKHLEAALASSARPLTRAQKKEVEALLERTRRFVATLDLSVQPPDATLLVNGEATQERTLRVSVGQVTVRAEREGYLPSERRLQVAGGQRHRVDLRLQPARAAQAEGAADDAAPAPEAALSPPPKRDTDEGSVWSSPLLWVGVAGVVAAGVVTAVLLSQSDDTAGELPEGTLGVSARALEAR